MQPLLYDRAADAQAAVRMGASNAQTPTVAPAQFLAGGTTLLDLMKLDVMRPTQLVDINDLKADYSKIDISAQGVKIGALASMADVASHAVLQRDYPVLTQALQLAASAQLRNMASVGGNVLQRTRCSYFRDSSWSQCNKRAPGSGCAALEGNNRKHAVLGVSQQCIASYPGDFAQALMVLDATLEIMSGNGQTRKLPFAQLHRDSTTPQIETVLAPGELITNITVPSGPWTRRSLYLKVRDRASYAFALCSAAVALELNADKTVTSVRIAPGGVAYKPWRAAQAEAFLVGKTLDLPTAMAAGTRAFEGAQVYRDNQFKPALGARVIARALLQANRMEVA